MKVANVNSVTSFDSVKYFLGQLCKNGHEFESSGKTLRYKSQHACPICLKDYHARHYQLNRKHIDAKTKSYVQEHPEAVKKIKERYRQSHRKEISIQGKEYRQRPEAKAKARSASKKPERKAYVKAYYQSPVGRLSQASGRYKRRARLNEVHHLPYTKADLKLLLDKFNNCCAYCGTSGKLHFDHWIPISKGGSDVAGNLLVACEPCNLSKYDKNGEVWYRSQSCFNISRWKKIQKHLSIEVCSGQLPLF